MHGAEHILIGVRTGDLQHARVALEDPLGPRAQAPGYDYPPVLLQGLPDRIQGLVDGGVDETARVDDHHVGRGVARRNLVPFRAQVSEDSLGVHERLGAAEADESDFGSSA